MKAQKKPVTVDYYDGPITKEDIQKWLDEFGDQFDDHFILINYHSNIYVKTLEGTSYSLTENEVIIRGIKGEYYPCKRDIFDETYSRLDEFGKELNQWHKIQEITKTFSIIIDNDKPYFEGFLVPSERYIYHYGESCLHVCGKIYTKENGFEFFGCIQSIDDSGISFFGKLESYDKALLRYNSFLNFIKKEHPFMPKKEELDKWCQDNLVDADKW